MTETLRRATPGDAEAVTALVRAAYGPWVPVVGREPLPMRVDYGSAIREHRIDLLFEGADLVALVETVARPDDLLIESVAVAPSWQGRGDGRRLLAHAERLAAEAGLPTVRLYTNALFERNLTLYASLGYEVERREAMNGGVAVHMRKAVP